MTLLLSLQIWIPPAIALLLLHTLDAAVALTPRLTPRQVPRRGTCVNGDIECYPPGKWFNGLICCSPGSLCAISEIYDQQGNFNAFCVPDPKNCYQGLFSCPPSVNACCPDEYICERRDFVNGSLPVCLSPLFFNVSSTTSSTTSTLRTTTSRLDTTSTTIKTSDGPTPPEQTQTPPPQSQPSGTTMSTPTLAGLIVGITIGSVLLTLALIFLIRRYRRHKKAAQAAQASGGDNETPGGGQGYEEAKYGNPGPFESGGNEILEADGGRRGGKVAELPGEGAGGVGEGKEEDLVRYELPAERDRDSMARGGPVGYGPMPAERDRDSMARGGPVGYGPMQGMGVGWQAGGDGVNRVRGES